MGSSIFFWRWPEFYQDKAREGHPPMFTGDPPTSKIPQSPYDDASVHQQVKDKIQRVMDRGYIVLPQMYLRTVILTVGALLIKNRCKFPE